MHDATREHNTAHMRRVTIEFEDRTQEFAKQLASVDTFFIFYKYLILVDIVKTSGGPL